jgi:hypothetical protein
MIGSETHDLSVNQGPCDLGQEMVHGSTLLFEIN